MIEWLLKKNLIPDHLVRLGIRRLLHGRLATETANYAPQCPDGLRRYAADLRTRPIAEQTRAANKQHYEVPTDFFQLCLGPRMKYSCCLYQTGRESLQEAEDAMLALYVERAQLGDGQRILDLGCGWGSLSLYLADRFPGAHVTAVSNSATQREYIERQAGLRSIRNLQVITADINSFVPPATGYHRVVSIEMLEHVKNYERLLNRIADWLEPEGRLFVQIFTHRRFAYHFEPRGPKDWMARYFFSGGQMPAHDLLPLFQNDLQLVTDWTVNGRHYQRTAEHWLRNLDQHKEEAVNILARTHGCREAKRWYAYWRTFFMSCAELWGYDGGAEWLVSHYLFQPQAKRARWAVGHGAKASALAAIETTR